jgi:hypothetical protein
MTARRGSSRGSFRARRLLVRRILAPLILLSSASFVCGTGYHGPKTYLEEGGRRVSASPEFYWELELKRLASRFRPTEKLLHRIIREEDEEGNPDYSRTVTDDLQDMTATADRADFAAALREGRIKPPDAAEATQQHEKARAALATDEAEPPPGFASEFADYHRGAFAFRRGPQHWPAARKVWEELLARPAAERHYRTVWAAFMIGKLLLKAEDPEAVQWFQRTRELAREGFSDSLGLAADSYGWEGRSQWKQDHPEKAAPLFLTQLALGDESAVFSLKALIPDRVPVEGMLNYGPQPDEPQEWDEATKERVLQQLRFAAKDPLLRQIVTMHILATETAGFYSEEAGRPAVTRTERWLAAIEEAKLGRTEGAEYLGWAAYTAGKYDQAARWLALSTGETPAGLWLKAKLQRRAGKLDDAVRTMAQAWETVRDSAAYSGWTPPAGSEVVSAPDEAESYHWTFQQSASGDLGGLRLARSEFVGALDALVKGDVWSDAAFVAERVLKTDELKNYVDGQPAAPASETKGEKSAASQLRYLLGRRLVRENRYSDALPYLPPPYDKLLDLYAKALRDAAATKLPKEVRARAYFTAAWIARYSGLELMGTEGAPDSFVTEGNLEEIDLAKERESGVSVQTHYDAEEKLVEQRVPISLKPSAQERERLRRHKIEPDVRWHYRIIAARLAIRAAELLPDDSEELADILNRAGLWVKDRDEKLGDRYHSMLVRRCPNTQIGRAAIARRWFVDQSGAWSEEQRAAHDAVVPQEPQPEE